MCGTEKRYQARYLYSIVNQWKIYKFMNGFFEKVSLEHLWTLFQCVKCTKMAIVFVTPTE